jgi:hypothetical protein
LRGQVGLGAVGAAVGDFLEQRGLRGRGADVLRRGRGCRRRRRALSLFPVVFVFNNDFSRLETNKALSTYIWFKFRVEL